MRLLEPFLSEPDRTKWERPLRAMAVRELSSFLETVTRWKESHEEPVVGRVKKSLDDPFAVLVATVLSLRTRDAVTSQAFGRLWELVRTPKALLLVSPALLEKTIRPVGFYRTKAKSLRAISAKLVQEYGGKVPEEMESLLALPGVGRKTANLVLIEGFGKEGICVDTHVHRILNWWGFVETACPDETEQILRRILPKRWWMPINGLLVSFGQEVCRPLAPRCRECPLARRCPYPGKRA